MPLQQSDVYSINFIVDLYTTIVIFHLTNRVAGKQLLMLCYVNLYVCVFRAEREIVTALKGLTPSGQLPMGVLAEGMEGISSGA